MRGRLMSLTARQNDSLTAMEAGPRAAESPASIVGLLQVGYTWTLACQYGREAPPLTSAQPAYRRTTPTRLLRLDATFSRQWSEPHGLTVASGGALQRWSR